MDAETGEILAVSNYPSFDPNDLSESESIHRRLAFATDPFEPGSTFKLLTVASALENNTVRPDTNYYCEMGRLKVEDHIISEAESKKKYEWMSVKEIIKHSSNVGTTKIAFDLTFPKLKETLKKFRIGEKTGIEIPGESRGIFTEDKNVSPLSLSNISFGQGVATTGIQMLAAYSAIANGGYYVKPTILKVDELSTIRKERIISEKTAEELKKMLVETIEDGTGKSGKIDYFTIAGKTSTAQRSDNQGGYTGYIPGFIGFPVGTNKKFVVYAYVDNPAPGKIYYGNHVAGPIFKKVTEFLLYKNKEFQALAKTENYKNKDAFDSVRFKRSSKRNIGAGLTPNFIGLDKKSAIKLADKLGLDLHHKGVGVVKSQIPESGEQTAENKVIKLIYSPPTYE
jgi:cell division protein FtsI (penicillin-binding protein 3)